MDIVRYLYLMEIMFNNNKLLFFVGFIGIGKLVYIKDKFMNGIDRDVFIFVFVNFLVWISVN